MSLLTNPDTKIINVFMTKIILKVSCLSLHFEFDHVSKVIIKMATSRRCGRPFNIKIPEIPLTIVVLETNHLTKSSWSTRSLQLP